MSNAWGIPIEIEKAVIERDNVVSIVVVNLVLKEQRNNLGNI